MSAAGLWLTLAAEGGTVLLGTVGALRLMRPARLTRDPRLVRLALFFALFALATAVRLIDSWLFEEALGSGDLARDVVDAHDVLFWVHHALLLVSLLFAALALTPPRGSVGKYAAYAPLLLWAEPGLRVVETAILVYVTVRSALHQTRRLTSVSSLAAIGWTLLVLAHALFLLQNEPLGPRDPWGVLLQLGGIIVLVGMLPWGRR